jgi:uncharacterized membrane protein YkgB
MVYLMTAFTVPFLITGSIVWVLHDYGASVSFGYGFLIWLVQEIVVMFYAWAVYRAAKEHARAGPPPREIKVHHCWIPLRAFQKMTYLFSRTDQEVRLVTRYHWITWASTAIPAGLLALILLVFGIYAKASELGHSATVRKHHFNVHEVPLTILVICIVLAIGLLAVVARALITWYSTYLVITDRQIILVTLPPIWFVFMEEDAEEITSHGHVHYFKMKQTMWGRIFGFGELTADTPSQMDKKFHDIGYIPRPADVRSIANEARELLAKRRE